jgi:hypothetical protein
MMMRVFWCVLAMLGTGAASADEVPMKKVIKDCDLRIEFEPREAMLHFRPSHPNGSECFLEPQVAEAGLREALDQRKDGAGPKLIFLGRLNQSHWLSDAVVLLAAYDHFGWDRQSGRPRQGNLNAYLANLLMSDRPVPKVQDAAEADILWPLRGVLAGHGYVVTGVSVEKVFVGDVDFFDGRTPSGRYPIDALVHLRITKAPMPSLPE